MEWRSKVDTALSAGRGLVSWIVHHPLLAASIVLALLLVRGGWDAGISRAQRAAGYLRMLATAGEQIEVLKKEIAVKDKAWERRESDARARAEKAEKALETARLRLAHARGVRQAPWSPPADMMELARRFEATGMPGRVK